MTRIVVFGATGFTGRHVIKEALSRGLQVTALVRSSPESLPEAVRVVQGDATDPAVRAHALEGADAVLLAMSPKGSMLGKLRGLYQQIADELAEGMRLVIVGGWSALLAPDGKHQLSHFPAEDSDQRRHYEEVVGVFDDFAARSDDVAWTYLTPPNWYGADVPEQHSVGSYRIGQDYPLAPRDGEDHTWISGQDMAKALVDQLTSTDDVGKMVNVAA